LPFCTACVKRLLKHEYCSYLPVLVAVMLVAHYFITHVLIIPTTKNLQLDRWLYHTWQ